jgi:hypothetical protein
MIVLAMQACIGLFLIKVEFKLSHGPLITRPFSPFGGEGRQSAMHRA